jgi:hypothetical protein
VLKRFFRFLCGFFFPDNVDLVMSLQFSHVLEKDTKWVRFGRFPAENVLHFPLAVMEIKLNDGAPAWVMDLVASGYLVWD